MVFRGNEVGAAADAGVPVSTLHRILSGATQEPKFSTLQKLARAYAVPLAWLTGEDPILLPVEQVDPDLAKISQTWWAALLVRYWMNKTADVRGFLDDPDLEAGVREAGLFAANEPFPGFLRPFFRPESMPDSYMPAFRLALEAWEAGLRLMLAEVKLRHVKKSKGTENTSA